MDLTPRKMQVLAKVVELYIQTGEPVGSKAVCDALGQSYSSATIRNDMSELSERGYLEQPHTSAGRVPSQKGYRLYIDKLMRPYQLTREDKQKLQSLMPRDIFEPDAFLKAVGQALAEFTQYACISTTPVDGGAKVQRVELIPMTRKIFLFVLLTTTGFMKSRTVRTEAQVAPEHLELFLRVVNAQVAGMPLSAVTPALAQTIAAALGGLALYLAPLLDVLLETARDACEAQLRLDGEANLLSHREFVGDKAQKLFSFLTRHDLLISLLSRNAGATNVVIGGEAQEDALDSSSIVTARYQVGGRNLGQIGIIGPTRMDYVHLIPSIEYFAAMMGKILSESVDLEEWSVEEDG